MTERDPNASLNECSYKPCRHYFRCQCHEQRAIARRSQYRNIVRRWSSHVPRIMYSRLFRREIRAFQVNTEDGRALPNDGIGCLQCKSHFFITVRYESGQQRRSSEFSVAAAIAQTPSKVGSSLKSTSPPPFTCRSMNPGARHAPSGKTWTDMVRGTSALGTT